MTMKILLKTIALVELATGVGLLFVASIVTELLLGHPLDSGVSIVVGRVAGLALIAIGLICWLQESRPPVGLIAGLLVYNVAVPVVLIHSYLAYGLGGVLLWPAVAVHLIVAAWLAVCHRQGRSTF